MIYVPVSEHTICETPSFRLLCEPKTMKPLLGIELDDASHIRTNHQARDEFVNRVFAAAAHLADLASHDFPGGPTH